MSESQNLAGAPPGVPGAIHAASVPPLLDVLCELAYEWIAANLPFTTAIDLAPRTQAAERTLGSRGAVQRTEIPRAGVAGGLPERSADLVVWVEPAPRHPIGAGLREAARLCRPDGTIACVLPAADSGAALEVPGFGEVARLELRPLIGAAIDSLPAGSAPTPGGPAPYRLLLLRSADPSNGAPPAAEDIVPVVLRDGERALRVELAAMTALQGMQEDERRELEESAARAQRDAHEERERADELGRRLAEAEARVAELRTGLAAGEELAEQVRKAQRETEELRAELDTHKGWLDEIQSSASWRLTRPLRRGKRALRP